MKLSRIYSALRGRAIGDTRYRKGDPFIVGSLSLPAGVTVSRSTISFPDYLSTIGGFWEALRETVGRSELQFDKLVWTGWRWRKIGTVRATIKESSDAEEAGVRLSAILDQKEVRS